MIILISTRLPEIIKEDMKNRFKNHELIFEKVDKLDDDILNRVDVIISGGRTFPDDFYKKASNLKLIQVPWIGINGFEFDKIGKYGIKIANSKWNTLLVAEFTLSMTLSLLKQITRADRIFRAGMWKSRRYTSRLLSNSNVFIIGFGDIGTQLARLLQSFNCSIIALKNNPDDVTEEQRELSEGIIGWEAYSMVAKKADIVIVTLPLTEKTEGILSEERLFQIKKGSYLINIGRGLVINEQGLFNVLEKKHLTGAAIDVWYQYKRDEKEPFYPSKYPFHELDNIIMSPHRASIILDAPERVLDDLEFNIKALEEGKSIKNEIDLINKY